MQRYLPIAAIVAIAAIFFALGGHQLVSIDFLAIHYGNLTEFVSQNFLLAVLVAGLAYISAVAIAFPAAWLITVAYGLLFGWVWGSLIVVISATIGACIIFLVARNLAEDFFRKKAGDRLNQMAEGFRKNAVSYMLFLRLAPIFPFLLVNVAPAILGVRLSTYAWTTLVGIIPGSVAYVFAGEGLKSLVQERAVACAAAVEPCGTAFSPADLVTREIVIAIALLAFVSLIPAIVSWWRNRPQNSGSMA